MNELIVAKLARRYEQFAAQELAIAVSNRDLEQLISDLLFESRCLWNALVTKRASARDVADILTERVQGYLIRVGRPSRAVPEQDFVLLASTIERLILELAG